MSIAIDGIIFSLQRHGGISVYFRELLAFLARQGEAFTLTLETPTQQDTAGLGQGGTLIERRARWLERLRASRLPPAATVFHSSYYRLPARRSVPTVVTVHDFMHERFRRDPAARTHSVQKRAAIRAAQAVICISQATRDDFRHYVGERPGQPVHVIHNGVADLFRPLALPAAPRPFVLFVGERRGYKNFGLVLQALDRLPDLELHCVGGGPLRPEELAAMSPSVRERAKHLGFVDDEALNRQYNQAVCLAYPSSHEGFGIPVVEAMRAGCPVVAVDCKAVLEVGGNALAVAPQADGEGLAQAITRTLAVERETLVRSGLAVAKGLSWEATHRATLQVYRSLQAGGAQAVR